MADTDAPQGAPSTTEDRPTAVQNELLKRLRTMYDRRKEVQDEIHRGGGHAERDAILLELCAFRGMQYTEAAQVIGYTREGVARRMRPLLDDLGLTDLTPFERAQTDIKRPLKRVATVDLIDRLQAAVATGARERNRELAAESRQLLKDMRATIKGLKNTGMTYGAQAEALGVTVSTIQRIRGVM